MKNITITTNFRVAEKAEIVRAVASKLLSCGANLILPNFARGIIDEGDSTKFVAPEKVYDKVAALGVKWIRIQSGWQKTEREEGVYDFAWLDKVVDNLIQAQTAHIKVLKTDAQWFGVTYKEDKPNVVASVNELVSAGVYPEKLWD